MLLSNYAIKFRTAVFVFVVVLVILGVASYRRLPREGAPDITIPYVFITAIYDGTAPEEIEKLITVPLEKKLNEVEGIKDVRSTSAENLSALTIEFQAGYDIDLALQHVKDKVDLASPDLPDDLDEPVVQAFNFSSDAPIFTFALSGETDLGRLKKLAERLQDEIELLPGIKSAEISGTREREIRVEIDLRRLAVYEVPMGVVLRRVAEENRTISAGNLEVEGDKFQIRVPGEFTLASSIEGILLQQRAGGPVYLRDIASVSDTTKDLSSISRLNGNPSVSVSVKKRTGENSVAVIEGVQGVLDRYTLPPGITCTAVYDESYYIDMMIKELENNIATGFILVVAVLLVFMGGRNSLFVAAAIPLSMLIAFAALELMGFTLNMIVLFTLVLAVGMLVDNAIVIVENIYRNRTLGLSSVEAARHGAAEVAWPVITSTLTTLAAFSPLLFWPGIMGQFMGFLPRTLITVLTASLFVAVVINPAVCSAFISNHGIGPRKRSPFVDAYERLLRGALRNRIPVVLIGFSFLVLSGLIYERYGRGLELFPETEPRHARVDVRFPEGTSIERTDAAIRAIESGLERYEDVKFYLSSVGAGAGGGFTTMGRAGTHMGSIHIQFYDADERKGSSMELVDRIRRDIGRIAGAEITVQKEEEGPPTGAPVAVEVSGHDFDLLADLAARIVGEIKTVPGLVDLQDDYEEALPELRFHVDRKRAALVGLDTESIGLFLRASVYGLEASKFRADEDEYDITVRLPESQRTTLDVLNEMSVPLYGGGTVPLLSLGHVRYAGAKGAINRKDQKRMITITGNNADRGVDEIIDDIKLRLRGMNLPSGYKIEYAGDTKEMQESGAFLARAFAMAVGLILVVLVIQFNSAMLPLIIIFSVILSLIGVMWGLLVCRLKFGVIMTGVGVISLAGIVVNNAIVLIDCIRQREAGGLSLNEAVVDAGRTRLRPVLLTATTTILGLIPMAVGYSLEVHRWPPRIAVGAESSAWWAPMAVAVIFGLGLATLLTLVLVPVMYSLAGSLRFRFLKHVAFSRD
jgi:multidrug efflux pump